MIDRPVEQARVSESLLRTLGGAAYVSAETYQRECETILERMWFCVAHVSDLPATGSFLTVQVGRESVLLTRNRRGEIRAFDNVCRHRGARLCLEQKGSLHRSIQCPYHAWTYDFDGGLIAAPNMTSMPDVTREAYALNRIQVRLWLGYVWICLAEQPESFEESVQQDVVDRLGELANLDAYAVEELRIGRRHRYDVAANWKLIIENFMECYHCATIHPELTEVLPEFADGFAAQFYVNHGAAFGEDVAGFTVDGSAGVTELPGLHDDQDRRYYAVTVRPQVFINLVPDHVIVHRMFPLAADRTVVECDWLYLPEVVEAGTDLDRSVELFHRVNQQDFDACERTQFGMGSRVYAGGGVLVPSEHHITSFHEWVNNRLNSGGAPTP